MEKDGAAVDDLASVLFALQDDRLTTGMVTARITQAIVSWALARGWLPRPEARVAFSGASETGFRSGYVDVVVLRGGGQPDLAIEIDSADKPWSVTKLKSLAGSGMRAIWVRWGDEVWAGVHDDIDVIQLPTRRRAGSRDREVGQMTLPL